MTNRNASAEAVLPVTTMKLVRSFVAVFSTGTGPLAPLESKQSGSANSELWHLTSTDEKIELAYVGLKGSQGPKGNLSDAAIQLVIGDDAEWPESQGRSCMAAAAYVEWDPSAKSLRVLSSLVGMPPIFVYQSRGVVAVASELSLLRSFLRSPLTIHPRSAIELFTVGYPLEYRTLFKDVTQLPAGYELRVDASGNVKTAPAWEPPRPRAEVTGVSQIELQVTSFRKSVTKLNLSDTLFTLTGGLDTRGIMAALAALDIKLTACTISGGGNLSLDARRARALCKAYGMPHVVVSLDEKFLRDLPAHVLDASRFSGGLSSLGQAHEVFLYRQFEGQWTRRLSGNIGNQIGRQGVEGISERKANLGILADSIRAMGGQPLAEHWISTACRTSGQSLTRLLLQQEAPFSSLANFSIGQHFLTQQSPYADRELIETTLSAPPSATPAPVFSPEQARMKDLRHRFFGQKTETSFQCKTVADVGGFVARYPINWGWRVSGGVSLPGLAMGVLAFADAASGRKGLPFRIVRQLLRAVKCNGLHEIKHTHQWFDNYLREFANDTLRSGAAANGEVFDSKQIVRHLDEHFGGVNAHYNTLFAALDLALAQQLFATA